MDGTAQCLAETLLSFFEERGIVLESLVMIQADGCPTNTGALGGAISIMEEHLCKPIQWNICLLHHVDLPFMELYRCLDGIGKRPRDKEFSGKKFVVGMMFKK